MNLKAKKCPVYVDTDCNQDNDKIKREINTQINDATTEDVEDKIAEAGKFLTLFGSTYHLTEEYTLAESINQSFKHAVSGPQKQGATRDPFTHVYGLQYIALFGSIDQSTSIWVIKFNLIHAYIPAILYSHYMYSTHLYFNKNNKLMQANKEYTLF